MERNEIVLPSSFRDPSGVVFSQAGIIYRRVNSSYAAHYDLLMSSGLYQRLAECGLLVSHEEVEQPEPGALFRQNEVPRERDNQTVYKVLRPEFIPFISYPYEWCFSQLKDAALLTLQIQKTALEYGLTLKDASAYNVQFLGGKPVLIDTLSFEQYVQGSPWVAYRQFCQHFLAPLALMSLCDIRLGQLFRVFIDGVPLDLASKLLPKRTWLKFAMLAHLHLHAASQRKYESAGAKAVENKMSRTAMLALVDSLETAVKKLSWGMGSSEWGDYYESTNYSEEAFAQKKQIVSSFLEKANPAQVWDLGANTGVFSVLAAERGSQVVSFDLDALAVERNYLSCRKRGESKILPLILDLTNPAPGIGWDNCERSSLFERGPIDLVLALALIHHLAISNNLPLSHIARTFKRFAPNLIIEFVPKEDSQVKKLLATRKDIFPEYSEAGFEQEFSAYFTILEKRNIKHSQRSLYLMQAR